MREGYRIEQKNTKEKVGGTVHPVMSKDLSALSCTLYSKHPAITNLFVKWCLNLKTSDVSLCIFPGAKWTSAMLKIWIFFKYM
jgi:hypothetical protein